MNGLTLNQKAILGKDYVVDATPTEGSDNLITSGAVYTAVQNAGSSPFVATYGTTTSAQIESAYQQNREIQLKYTKSSGSTTHTYISSDFVRNSATDVRWLITDSSGSSNSITFISCISNTWSVQDSLSLDDQKWLSSTNYGGLVVSGYTARRQFTGIRFNDLTYFAAKKLWIGVISNVPSSSPQYKLGISEDDGKNWRMLAIADSGTAPFTNIISSVRYDSDTSTYVPCVYVFGNSTVYHSYDPVNGTWKQNFSTILVSKEAGAAATGPAVESFAGNSNYRSVVFPKNSESTNTYYAYISGTSDRWESRDNLPAEGSFRAVTYDEYNGRFIAVGFGSNIALYSDYAGTTFTSSTLPLTSDWCSIAYGNGAVIAISSSNLYRGTVSKDHGVSWTEVDLTPAIECAPLVDSANAKWTSICYGEGKFIITGQNIGYSLVSTNGDTWYPIALPNVRTESTSNAGITYANSKFILYSAENTSLHVYESSGNTQLINQISSKIKTPVYLVIDYFQEGKLHDYTAYALGVEVFHDGSSQGDTLSYAEAYERFKDGCELIVEMQTDTGIYSRFAGVHPTLKAKPENNLYYFMFSILTESYISTSKDYNYNCGYDCQLSYQGNSANLSFTYYSNGPVIFYLMDNGSNKYNIHFENLDIGTSRIRGLSLLYDLYKLSNSFIYHSSDTDNMYTCLLSYNNSTSRLYMSCLVNGSWKTIEVFYDTSGRYFYTTSSFG